MNSCHCDLAALSLEEFQVASNAIVAHEQTVPVKSGHILSLTVAHAETVAFKLISIWSSKKGSH